MILVSIHPFAFRRLFLILLALLGFSALCFADPVLMAHRYGAENSRLPAVRNAATPLRIPAAGRETNFAAPRLSSFATSTDLDLEKAPRVSFSEPFHFPY